MRVSHTTPNLLNPGLDSLATTLEKVSKNATVVKATAQMNDKLSGTSYFYAYYQNPSGRTKLINFNLNFSTGETLYKNGLVALASNLANGKVVITAINGNKEVRRYIYIYIEDRSIYNN